MAVAAENLKINDIDIDTDAFRAAILDWYEKEARTLPWRAPFGQKPDPYHEWLSEIMLQQTVVKAVIPYFLKFTKQWPSVHDLANASSEDVMRDWAGLGYYARARNLHKCAKVVSEKYKGVFPDNEAELKKLPGIGPYTAAAMISIALGKPSVVMDGNIERVLARVFAHEKPIRESKKELYEYAKFLSEERTDYPGEYAQGLMDLGAAVCTPTSPKCGICPIKEFCTSFDEGLQEQIPVKAKKAIKPIKYGTLYFVENEKGELLFERRPEKGLLGGMIGIPGSEWADQPQDPSRKLKNLQINHTFTHFHLILDGVALTEENMPYINNREYFWKMVEGYDKIGLPTLFKKSLKQYLKLKK